MKKEDYVKPAVIKALIGFESRVLREAYLNDELPKGAVLMSSGGHCSFHVELCRKWGQDNAEKFKRAYKLRKKMK